MREKPLNAINDALKASLTQVIKDGKGNLHVFDKYLSTLTMCKAFFQALGFIRVQSKLLAFLDLT